MSGIVHCLRRGAESKARPVNPGGGGSGRRWLWLAVSCEKVRLGVELAGRAFQLAGMTSTPSLHQLFPRPGAQSRGDGLSGKEPQADLWYDHDTHLAVVRSLGHAPPVGIDANAVDGESGHFIGSHGECPLMIAQRHAVWSPVPKTISCQ